MCDYRVTLPTSTHKSSKCHSKLLYSFAANSVIKQLGQSNQITCMTVLMITMEFESMCKTSIFDSVLEVVITKKNIAIQTLFVHGICVFIKSHRLPKVMKMDGMVFIIYWIPFFPFLWTKIHFDVCVLSHHMQNEFVLISFGFRCIDEHYILILFAD